MQSTLPAETLLIEGPDAIAFAQAQFSSNVVSLATGNWQFSAWLDSSGRVRALFHLARHADDRLLLLLRGGDAASIATALHRFVFRSKLSITAMPPRSLVTGDALPNHVAYLDGETAIFGCGSHSMHSAAAVPGDDRWRWLQLRQGWPWLPTVTLGELLPPALSLHRLQAVAIDKGCYPGQEMVARLHYRGGHKRHLHGVELSHPSVAGQTLRVNGQDVRLLDVVASDTAIEALAVVDDTLAAQAVDGCLRMPDDQLVIHLQNAWPA
jgi:folate-binding protein YgfZ